MRLYGLSCVALGVLGDFGDFGELGVLGDLGVSGDGSRSVGDFGVPFGDSKIGGNPIGRGESLTAGDDLLLRAFRRDPALPLLAGST